MILAPFRFPEPGRVDRRRELDRARAELLGLDPPGLRIVDIPPQLARVGYVNVVRAAWCTVEDLVVVEHDIVPTAAALASFDTCEHPLCAVAYLIHRDTLGPLTGGPVYVHRAGIAGQLEWIREGDLWADRVGLGLTRIRWEARALAGWPDDRAGQLTYENLDEQLSGWLADRLGTRWHVHWPAVEHLHQTP